MAPVADAIIVPSPPSPVGSASFIERHENVFFVGPAGVGKSHLAQALGHEACRRGYDVLFMPASPLARNDPGLLVRNGPGHRECLDERRVGGGRAAGASTMTGHGHEAAMPDLSPMVSA